MATLTVKTNNIPRDVLAWFDLTRDERANFAHYRGEDDGAARHPVLIVRDAGELITAARAAGVDILDERGDA